MRDTYTFFPRKITFSYVNLSSLNVVITMKMDYSYVSCIIFIIEWQFS